MCDACSFLINAVGVRKLQETRVIYSMTGFASAQGEIADFSWQIEMRSVNHRGLDIKLRAPDWIDGFDSAARAHLQKQVARGAIYVTIKLRDESQLHSGPSLDPVAIQKTLDGIRMIEDQAMDLGVNLAPSKASDLLHAAFGSWEKTLEEDKAGHLKSSLLEIFEEVTEAFVGSRRDEGEALKEVLLTQSSQMTRLLDDAVELARGRDLQLREKFHSQLKLVMDTLAEVDPQRLAQELATLLIKMDVTEEIDRLRVHVKSLLDLLLKGGAIGRKLDFLMQEFNREANTLCSKSQNSALTSIGLELKVLIDQMREQVQNVE